MGFYGTETSIITGLGFVTYWIKGCDPTFGGVTSPVTDDTIPPVIYEAKGVEAAQVNNNTTLIAAVVSVLGVLIVITWLLVFVVCYKRCLCKKPLTFENKL